MTKQNQNRENMALVLALLRSTQQFHRAIGPVFRATGLTTTQWDVLETLSNKGPLTVNELLLRALGTSGNLDVVIKNLIKMGWVEKTIGKTDRRSRVIALTEAGKAKVEAFLPQHNLALEQMFENLTVSEKQQTIRALNRLRRILHDTPKGTDK